ncbi:hypothetical protein AQ490_03095 [Wenjunlia vitaminophila]|uniref:SIMPL domain-containing protein n=2 Tax=Wenjunlia vitaminophila TaxID=76728 RepID=A0A0T6LTJ6_WENVI|nr:hypothetical protein AQ490_03095 [Wenjunlia vitaminophila]
MPPILPTPFGTAEEPRVRVRGEAMVEAQPELATIHVTVTARGKDRRHTLEELTRRNSAVLDLLKTRSEAVDSVDSGAFSITPELDDRRGEKVRAYQGRVLIRAALTDFTVLGELTTRLADLELTRVAGPWWSLRPDSPVHREARQKAVHEAVQRAREYAEALGAELKALLDLADTGLDRDPSMPYGRFGRGEARARAGGPPGASAAPALQLEPKLQRVSAEVTASFSMTRPDLRAGRS